MRQNGLYILADIAAENSLCFETAKKYLKTDINKIKKLKILTIPSKSSKI